VQAVGATPYCLRPARINSNVFVPEGYVPPKGAGMTLAWNSSGYWATIRASGIVFSHPAWAMTLTETDFVPALTLVIIVNRTLAEHYWGPRDRKRIHIGMPESPTPWLTVVERAQGIKQTRRMPDTANTNLRPARQQRRL